MKKPPSLKDFLDRKVEEYNQPGFITSDPVSVPHLFTKKQDIEIAALFASIFAWGNRTTIIQKSKELMQLMDMAPHQFVLQHKGKDLKKMLAFKHRTFNTTDLLYFIQFLRHHYQRSETLETAFTGNPEPVQGERVQWALDYFYAYFFSLEDAPARTHKHIASPAKHSTCKRLNMFLRWMVRADDRGVDFGIWKNIQPSDLICPIDLHVARVGKRFGLINRNQVDWLTAIELTTYLRTLDATDPAKYDFALFGLGVMEKF
jgi:uncharacterized protein (TIGR02757 family)